MNRKQAVTLLATSKQVLATRYGSDMPGSPTHSLQSPKPDSLLELIGEAATHIPDDVAKPIRKFPGDSSLPPVID